MANNFKLYHFSQYKVNYFSFDKALESKITKQKGTSIILIQGSWDDRHFHPTFDFAGLQSPHLRWYWDKRVTLRRRTDAGDHTDCWPWGSRFLSSVTLWKWFNLQFWLFTRKVEWFSWFFRTLRLNVAFMTKFGTLVARRFLFLWSKVHYVIGDCVTWL